MIETIEDNEQDRIINEQLQLGQRATLNGMWTRGWVTEQETFLRRIIGRKSPKVWMIKLSILLQNMTHNMWKTRNEEIHKKEDSALNIQRHEELDQQDIDTIFGDRPHSKFLPPSGAMQPFLGEERRELRDIELERKKFG